MTSPTPEHDKRELAHGLHPDVDAAYDYVISVRSTADAGAGAWHGWALREAFLAGVSHCERGLPPGSPARIMHLVDDWLAEDASIDPIVVFGEVAAVLARIEQESN